MLAVSGLPILLVGPSRQPPITVGLIGRLVLGTLVLALGIWMPSEPVR